MSPKYDMNIYMASLLGGEAWGLCVESRVEQKAIS